MFPSPDELNITTWKLVLNRMGQRLGMTPVAWEAGTGGNRVQHSQIFPDSSLLSKDEWQAIMDYYLNNAPVELASTSYELDSTDLFNPVWPEHYWGVPQTTSVKYDVQGGNLWISDLNTRTSYLLDLKQRVENSLVTGAVSDIQFYDYGAQITNIGFFLPSDHPVGQLLAVHLDGNRIDILSKEKKLRNLQRPVFSSLKDMDGDGSSDYLVSEFGNLLGTFGWYDRNNQYNALKAVPGALQVRFSDFNQDGLDDILVLFGQGDESIDLFTNKGDGKFSYRQLLRFPPSYGSLYFDYVDLNQDGFKDIVHVCGDNADYAPILKPYHGIRIYLNDGKNNFVEKVFLPMNGATKVACHDFNGDGEVDIAAIAFFPDFSNFYDENFLYFEKTGRLTYTRKRLPQDVPGRWISMDAGDFDKDGDIDIILGAMNNAEIPNNQKLIQELFNSKIPYVILKNEVVSPS